MEHSEEFIATIKENEGIIYKITRVYASNTEDQKDLYQEIVYQLWKSHDTFQGKSKRSTWMYRVALNTSIAYLNRGKRNAQHSISEFNLDQIEDEISWEEEERIKILYAHIKQLSVIEKGLILLYLEGKSHEEIAGIIGFTVSNVGTRIARIKQKLKTQIIKN